MSWNWKKFDLTSQNFDNFQKPAAWHSLPPQGTLDLAHWSPADQNCQGAISSQGMTKAKCYNCSELSKFFLLVLTSGSFCMKNWTCKGEFSTTSFINSTDAKLIIFAFQQIWNDGISVFWTNHSNLQHCNY